MAERDERVKMPDRGDESEAEASPSDASEGRSEADSPRRWRGDDEPVPGSSDSEVQT